MFGQEVLNEIIAPGICRILGFHHCSYALELIDHTLVCKSEVMIGADKEMIPASDFFFYFPKPEHLSDTEHYIQILESHGITNARQEVELMLILDFLMMNTDRHMGNFGIILSAETLVWEKTIPLFDTGCSLNSRTALSEQN